MQLTALSLALTRIGLGGFGVGSSLNLDFTSGNRTLDPRITFSRASNATVTGPDGTLQYAPHNLLTFSEQFDNANWSKALCAAAANAVVAPDGTTTADSLVEDTTSGFRAFVQNFTALAGTTYTISFYVKAATRSLVRVYVGAAASWTSAPSVVFDLSAGTIVSGVNGTITPVGTDGWYRCSVVGVFGATGGAASSAVGPVLSGGSTNNYLGAGAIALHIWGAQLNVGSLQPYYPTTVKNLLGFTQEFDNAAWTKSNSFVQTNLLTWSEQFDNAAWAKSNATVTANATTAPDGSLTADKLVEDTSTGNHVLQSAAVTLTAVPTTFSVFVKEDGRDWVAFRVQGVTRAYFNISTGTVGTVDASTTASITSVGDKWYRCSITLTPSAGAANIFIRLATADGTDSYTGDGTDGVLLWGAQLVQGSTPGDYQRTEGTARAVMYPAPDGSRTADKLVEDAANASHSVFQAVSGTFSQAPYTVSLYAKAAERTSVSLWVRGASSGNRFEFAVNLSTGVVSGAQNIGNFTNGTAAVVSVGNGWYRISATVTPGAGETNLRLQTFLFGSGTVSNPNYTGDGTSGIYIWGAQLSDSASLDPYVYNPGAAPTAAAYYGPRFDYDPVTLAPRGLLIEEQRTNLVYPSNPPTMAAGTITGLIQANGATTITSGVTAPDGTSSGFTVTGASVGTNSNGANNLRIQPGVLTTIGTYAVSMWIKTNGSSTTVSVREASSNSIQTFTTSGVWTRVIAVFTTTATSQNIIIYSTGGAAFDCFGIQAEAGAFPTSYIPTSGAAATRAADVAVMTGANFSNWYRQDEGTLFAEGSSASTSRVLVAVDDGSMSNRYQLAIAGGYTPNFAAVSGGVVSADLYASAQAFGSFVKSAGTYRVNDFALSANGASAVTDTSGALPVAVSVMRLGAWQNGTGYLGGHIRKIAYFPRRLSNAELQGITS